MKDRDKAILSDLARFRCLTRADITELHFSGLKKDVDQTNTVLKRMRRDGLIDCVTDRRMYIYLPKPSSIKRDSAKISHFLAIADFYKQVRKIEPPKEFIVEPKFGDKGNPEPDIFMIWQRTPFFVEIQRSIYSEKVMSEKMKRYERYWIGEEWHNEPWQPVDKKIFPLVWIISDKQYRLETPFRVVQSKDAKGLTKK